MKSPYILTLGGLTIALTSCGVMESFNQPLSGSGGFDPLSAPGMGQTGSAAVVVPSAPNYQPGQWVETSMPNATFFVTIPTGNATANKMLPVSTPLKVISTSGTYVKVELDSGEIGFVPEIMIAERSAATTVPIVPPPVDGGLQVAPVPEVPGLPAGAPPVPDVAPLPDVAPPPEVPGIAPPKTVD